MLNNPILLLRNSVLLLSISITFLGIFLFGSISNLISMFQYLFELIANIGICIMGLIDYLLGIVGIIFLYLFIFINLMIPRLILLGYLGYKSKPEEESFQKSFKDIISFSMKQNDNNTNYLKRFMYHNILKFYVSCDIISKVNILFYDLGVARIAYITMNDNTESHLVIGIFGTWIPCY